MIIKSVVVKHFRSILDETLHCEQLTALVGANGAGKSSMLRAIDLFYSPSPRLEIEDFYDRDATQPIIVAITFTSLSPEASALFATYLQGDTLTVERVFTWENEKASSKYHGASLQNPAFEPVRQAGPARDKKSAYDHLRQTAQYASLPQWQNQTEGIENLKQWESAHAEQCVRQRDEGQFFGFNEVGQGYLGRFTRFLFIQAVRDAAHDSSEGKGSILTGLMDLVVRSVLANKAAIKTLTEDTQTRYEEILKPENLTELTTLADRMTTTLRTFVPDAAVDLQWLPLDNVNIPLPKADVKLVEDGYSSAVNRTGHGLQRAFILTMLQHLAFAKEATPSSTGPSNSPAGAPPTVTLPGLVLAIEEPELYQHPNRQRHLARILMQLAQGTVPGVADKTQVLYATHSPLFVGIDRIDQLRLLRKVTHGSKPKVTCIVQTSLEVVAGALWEANGAQGPVYTAATLLPRLQAVMTPWMSEGFFADVAVLVEGEDDYAAILGAAKTIGYDLNSQGVSVIPCGGKTNLDRPAAVFQKLGIPIYLLWDSDKGEADSKPEDNHRLLRLLGEAPVDWPAGVNNRFACFPKDLQATLQEEIGPELFESCLAESQAEYRIPKRGHALKNPVIVASILQKAQTQGKAASTLPSVLSKIVALNPRTSEGQPPP